MLESERENGPARADGFRAVRLRFGDDWTAVHRLVDGTKMRLRLLRAEDRDWLVKGFEKLSPESRYRRFCTAMPRLPASVLERLLRVDGSRCRGAGMMPAPIPECRSLSVESVTLLDSAPSGT